MTRYVFSLHIRVKFLPIIPISITEHMQIQILVGTFDDAPIRKASSGEASHGTKANFGHENANVYRPYKESTSKEMNNDNDLNLHLHDQMSGFATA